MGVGVGVWEDVALGAGVERPAGRAPGDEDEADSGSVYEPESEADESLDEADR